MRLRVLVGVLGSMMLAAACGGDDTGVGPSLVGGDDDTIDGTDSGNDGTVSQDGTTPNDASHDGTTDGANEAGGDASEDANADAGVDAGEDADAGDPPPPPPPPPFTHYDINHVIVTGASDSVANGGVNFLTSTQPFGNLSFKGGVFTGRGTPGNVNANNCNGTGCTGSRDTTSFIPLTEGWSFLTTSKLETIGSGFANQASVLATSYFANVGIPYNSHDILVSNHGRSGNPYWCLRWQTVNVQTPMYGPCNQLASSGYIAGFEEAMTAVTNAKAIADAQGKTYALRAVNVIAGQGESDNYSDFFPNFLRSTDPSHVLLANYTEALADWKWDYDTRVKAITGQAESVPFFMSQFGSMSTTTPDFSVIPQQQLDAHVMSGGGINLVAPNYPFEAYTDCLHYTNHSQRRLGAYFAKAYQKVVVENGVWEPTRPLSITRVGATLVVKYVVPVPPLVIDTTRVAVPNPAAFAVTAARPNPIVPVLGFIFRDSTNSAKITSVVVSGPDEVTITLDKTPTGTGKMLRYAYERQSTGACPGPTNGARGNIRDSDSTPGYYSDAGNKPYELFNWSVAFQMDVP